MKCPYCKHEQLDDAIFCSECGQSLNLEQKAINADDYWNNVNSARKKHNKDYIAKKNHQKSEVGKAKFKTIIALIGAVLFVVATVLIIKGVGNYNENKLKSVKDNLPGVELSCHYSKTETGFWINHYYHKIIFKDDGTLSYYFIKTTGPAEDDEYPSYEGTYSYTITRSVFGEYLLSFGDKSFKMSVNSNDIPVSLSNNK